MRLIKITFICSFAVTVSGCTLWGWIYGAKKPLKNEDFSFYDPNFEYTNLKKIKTTNLRFDGFYYKKSAFPHDNEISWEIRKFFRNGRINEGVTTTEIGRIKGLLDGPAYNYGFYKLSGDTIFTEIKNNDFPKYATYTTYLIGRDKLLEVTPKRDTVVYNFYYEPSSSLYPVEKK